MRIDGVLDTVREEESVERVYAPPTECDKTTVIGVVAARGRREPADRRYRGCSTRHRRAPAERVLVEVRTSHRRRRLCRSARYMVNIGREL